MHNRLELPPQIYMLYVSDGMELLRKLWRCVMAVRKSNKYDENTEVYGVRFQEFREYLQKMKIDPKELFDVPALYRFVEMNPNINIDKEFECDGMDLIIRQLRYTKKDQLMMRGYFINIGGELKSRYKSITAYKTALNHYKRFCIWMANDKSHEYLGTSDQNLGRPVKDEVGKLHPLFNKTFEGFDPSVDIISHEYPSVDGGRMDFYAKRGRTHVAIEIKTDEAGDGAIGQLMGYITSIHKETGIKWSKIQGILVAHSFSERTINTADAFPNIQLLYYGTKKKQINYRYHNDG